MNTHRLLVGLLLCAAARALPVETNACRFGIFMPREDVCNVTPDVAERVRTFYRSQPQDIPLAKYPLISDQDLQSYDWKTHTLTVDQHALWRIHRPTVRGLPFVVVADGNPVYVGAFFTGISSMTCSVPIILYEDARATNVVQIHESYHGEPAGRSDKDPRADLRLKKALQALGKLKE